MTYLQHCRRARSGVDIPVMLIAPGRSPDAADFLNRYPNISGIRVLYFLEAQISTDLSKELTLSLPF